MKAVNIHRSHLLSKWVSYSSLMSQLSICLFAVTQLWKQIHFFETEALTNQIQRFKAKLSCRSRKVLMVPKVEVSMLMMLCFMWLVTKWCLTSQNVLEPGNDKTIGQFNESLKHELHICYAGFFQRSPVRNRVRCKVLSWQSNSNVVKLCVCITQTCRPHSFWQDNKTLKLKQEHPFPGWFKPHSVCHKQWRFQCQRLWLAETRPSTSMLLLKTEIHPPSPQRLKQVSVSGCFLIHCGLTAGPKHTAC